MSTSERWRRFRLPEEDARRVAAVAVSSVFFALLPIAAARTVPAIGAAPSITCAAAASRHEDGAIRCDDRGETLDGAALLLSGVKLDLNRATAKDLELIPEIGPKVAAQIVAERDQNGPFCGASDLTRVRGIGPIRAAKIAPFTRPSPTPAPPCR